MKEHTLADGLGILALLSTGEEEDLATVSAIYRERMSAFQPESIPNHSWNNGYQGIAACEYYLRSGDKSVIPLIDALCESARKWEVHGGWTHWAGAITKYGVVNACGTNVLTTLLLAKQCGAEVDEATLQRSLRFFYRFAGHGANPYGHHRPEDGYDSNNGRIMMLGFTAPKKQLQILGATPSKHAVPFTLPKLPWGREADLTFFKLEGGAAYQASGLPPHLEFASIVKADKEQLQSFARHTGCMA